MPMYRETSEVSRRPHMVQGVSSILTWGPNANGSRY